MFTELRPAIVIFLLLTLITGVAYPGLITLIGQAAFNHQANGSVIKQADKVVGSELIGQSFDQPNYFWGRPSATGPVPYNAASSSGSNLGPTNPALIEAVQGRIDQYKKSRPWQSARDSGRIGHGIRQWARSAYQPCRSAVPNRPRGPGPQSDRNGSYDLDSATYKTSSVGNNWRTVH